MADPIIRILVEEAAPGGAPGRPGPPAGGGGAPAVKDRSGEDEASQVARAVRGMLGRMLPGGQRTLDLLGLGDTIDELSGKVAPALKRLADTVSDFVKDVLGTGDSLGARDEGEALDKKVADQFVGVRDQKDVPNIGGGGEKKPEYDLPDEIRPSGKDGGGKKVAKDVAKKAAKKASGGEGGEAAEGAEGAAEGAAAEGGLGALADLAGPVGIAILAFEAIGEAGEMAASAIRGLGDIGVDVVNNNPAAAMRRVADGVLETVDQVPVVGKALTALPKAFLAAADAATALKDAFLANARHLSQYSGELSSAEALADVRHILADLEEAQRTGGRLSQVVELQSKIDVEFQKAMEPLKEDLLELLVPLMEAVLNVAKRLHQLSDGVHEVAHDVAVATGVEAFFKWVKDHWPWKDEDEDEFGDWNALAESFFHINPAAESGSNPAPPGGFGGAPG